MNMKPQQPDNASLLRNLERRLNEARDRLRAALVAGESTEPHRTAVDQISADLERERAAKAKVDDVAERHRTADIANRAAAIAGEARERIDAILANFPIQTEFEP